MVRGKRFVRVFYNPMAQYINVFIGQEDERGKRYFAEDVKVSEVSEADIPPHAMQLEPEAAQRLMDDLWNVGIRPTEGHGSAGQLAATEAHLKDVQGLLREVLPSALRTLR